MLPIKPGAPVQGNKEVVEVLENWLARARLGQLNFVALVSCEGPQAVFQDHAGVAEAYFAASFGLEHLKKRLADILLMKGGDQPKQENVSADQVCYDLAREPVAYDFLTWLLIAELRRRAEGAPAPLKVRFLNEDYPVGYHQAFYRNVLRPAVQLAGAVIVTDEPPRGRHINAYTVRELVEACRVGWPLPGFRAPADAATRMAGYAGCVTITLREAEHWPHRNSNLEQWLLLAADLVSEGERVVFVRDTAKAVEPIEGYATCPEASCNLHSRMALYEVAACNLFVPNGPPCSLAWFSRAPWLMFWHMDPMDPYVPITPNWVRDHMALEQGEQLPWAGPHQRIVWTSDDIAPMRSAWAEMRKVIGTAAERKNAG